MSDMFQTSASTSRPSRRLRPRPPRPLLADIYLTHREAASAQVFRVYLPTPPHYHPTCNEYLIALSGCGTF